MSSISLFCDNTTKEAKKVFHGGLSNLVNSAIEARTSSIVALCLKLKIRSNRKRPTPMAVLALISFNPTSTNPTYTKAGNSTSGTTSW